MPTTKNLNIIFINRIAQCTVGTFNAIRLLKTTNFISSLELNQNRSKYCALNFNATLNKVASYIMIQISFCC